MAVGAELHADFSESIRPGLSTADWTKSTRLQIERVAQNCLKPQSIGIGDLARIRNGRRGEQRSRVRHRASLRVEAHEVVRTIAHDWAAYRPSVLPRLEVCELSAYASPGERAVLKEAE
jgi:hypothetical protein